MLEYKKTEVVDSNVRTTDIRLLVRFSFGVWGFSFGSRRRGSARRALRRLEPNRLSKSLNRIKKLEFL